MSIQKVGVINNYTVIDAVGRTLAELLQTDMEAPVKVTISSPGEDYGVPVGGDGEEQGTSRVNLFLYRVEEAPHTLNNDWIDVGDGKQIPFPLTLNLYYMLNIFTPDKSNNLDEHRILGDVMRVFHANRIVNPIYFEGTLNPNEPPIGIPWEELTIIHHPLPLEELAAVWHAINKPYRLSLAYEVSVVSIDPPDYTSRRVRRVDVTHVEANPFKGCPAIERISPERGYGGNPLIIYGGGFESPFLRVFLNDNSIEPVSMSRTEISLTLPENLPPGLYTVKVCTEEGCSNTVRFEEISPFLYKLDPNLKYTEDADFPKDSTGLPQLSIWGGNFLTEPPLPIEILAGREGGAEIAYPVAAEQLSRNSIKWGIPEDMREGQTTIRARQTISPGITRMSNSLILEIPVPQIYRVDPDVVSSLPREIIVVGDHFTSNFIHLYLHPGSYKGKGDLDISELVPIAVDSANNKIMTTLPNTTPPDTYQLVVEVHGKYYSQPYEINIEAGTI